MAPLWDTEIATAQSDQRLHAHFDDGTKNAEQPLEILYAWSQYIAGEDEQVARAPVDNPCADHLEYSVGLETILREASFKMRTGEAI